MLSRLTNKKRTQPHPTCHTISLANKNNSDTYRMSCTRDEPFPQLAHEFHTPTSALMGRGDRIKGREGREEASFIKLSPAPAQNHTGVGSSVGSPQNARPYTSISPSSPIESVCERERESGSVSLRTDSLQSRLTE